MTYEEFLDRVIASGVAAARADYNKDAEKRAGSVAGFEACRGLQPSGLKTLLEDARELTRDKYLSMAPDYWYWRCREAEIEWVVNCVSALMVAGGYAPIQAPTARGVVNAARILNAA